MRGSAVSAWPACGGSRCSTVGRPPPNGCGRRPRPPSRTGRRKRHEGRTRTARRGEGLQNDQQGQAHRPPVHPDPSRSRHGPYCLLSTSLPARRAPSPWSSASPSCPSGSSTRRSATAPTGCSPTCCATGRARGSACRAGPRSPAGRTSRRRAHRPRVRPYAGCADLRVTARCRPSSGAPIRSDSVTSPRRAHGSEVTPGHDTAFWHHIRVAERRCGGGPLRPLPGGRRADLHRRRLGHADRRATLDARTRRYDAPPQTARIADEDGSGARATACAPA
jgi:hypothetical protein